MPPHIRTVDILSLSQLIDETAKLSAVGTTLFRGQAGSEWTLRPKIGRDIFKDTPLRSRTQLESGLIAEFKRLAVPFVQEQHLSSAWETLATAQHFGLPTRLLDWSTNPLVAAWFAVSHSTCVEPHGAIWRYETDDAEIVQPEDDPFKLPRTLFYSPRHINVRIVAQGGWFSVHRFDAPTKNYSALEYLDLHHKRLVRFRVARAAFGQVRSELAKCGIHRASLFPDLAGLCDHLVWQSLENA